ncbi:MAG: sigma-70 family RNA polymerase sigma factor [Planctomycetota bacterium]
MKPGAASRVQRTPEERDKLVEAYLPLVRYVVARLPVTMPATLDRDDFYSTGVLGLIHAATTYDPLRGASFKTFAYTAIRGAILDEIRRHDPVPRNRRDRLRLLEATQKELYARLQREPTQAEVAEAMGVSQDDLDADLQALHTARTLSLDETTGGDDDGLSTWAALLADPVAADPGDRAVDSERRELLAKAIAELPETDRHVVVLYYHERLYLKEIGQVLQVTESRVSQILSRAIERLRLKLGAEVPA